MLSVHRKKPENILLSFKYSSSKNVANMYKVKSIELQKFLIPGCKLMMTVYNSNSPTFVSGWFF